MCVCDIYVCVCTDVTVIQSYELKTRCGTKEEIPYDQPAITDEEFIGQRRIGKSMPYGP